LQTFVSRPTVSFPSGVVRRSASGILPLNLC
jgi:hypothetical protein